MFLKWSGLSVLMIVEKSLIEFDWLIVWKSSLVLVKRFFSLCGMVGFLSLRFFDLICVVSIGVLRRVRMMSVIVVDSSFRFFI